MADFNMNSILDSVKKDLGIMPDYTHFDPELIMKINTAFSVLTQRGVGPKAGFSISDNTAVWSDFIPEDPRLNMYKQYVSMKTKILFDTNNLTGPVLESMNRQLSDMEWRLNVLVDPGEENT